MKKLKIAMLSVLSMLAIIGLVYGAMTTQFMADKSLDKVSIEVTKTATRDFERNIFVVETDMQSEIMYSVVQGKNLRATAHGLEPGYILAKRGDTVKLNLISDVYCDFNVDGYRVDARTQPNTVTEVTFNADLPGIFVYRCAGLFDDRSTVGLLEIVE